MTLGGSFLSSYSPLFSGVSVLFPSVERLYFVRCLSNSLRSLCSSLFCFTHTLTRSITIYRIQSYLHQILNLVLDGLQGFFVALIVCYTNRTVIERVRVWVKQKRDEHKLR